MPARTHQSELNPQLLEKEYCLDKDRLTFAPAKGLKVNQAASSLRWKDVKSYTDDMQKKGPGIYQDLIDAVRRLPAPERKIVATTLALEEGLLQDSPLTRLQARYEERLQEYVSPEGGISTIQQARDAKKFARTYDNLAAHLVASGIQPPPRDPKITEAERLASAFYKRERDAVNPPRPRGRPAKLVKAAVI